MVNPLDLFKAQDQASKAILKDAVSRAVRSGTTDGFDNFLSRVGLQNDNTLSASTYNFNLVTRNRLLLEAGYRGSWVVGVVIDSVAEDMTRAGITIKTAKGSDRIEDMRAAMVRLKIWTSVQNEIKWGRLYGGALGYLQIRGQDPATPLVVDTIAKGQFQGIVVFDRWTVNPMLTPAINFGPDMGLPAFYQITNQPTQTDPKVATDGFPRVHHSRMIRYTGIDLPWYQAITEQMWGESVLERLWDRLISFDNATMSSASLIDRADLRTVGIEGLREIIAAGGDAQRGLEKMFEMMDLLQSNQRMTLIDKNDSFQSTAYSFAGLSDMMLQFGQQLAGASGIPLIRLFGQSPAGLSATGDADIRMYYDNINAQQEAKLRNPFEVLLKVIWRSTFGDSAPDDLEFTFTPLWQMSATDQATVSKTNAETVIGVHEAGLVPTDTAMRELRNSSGDAGLFSNISDEDIAEAELEEPPMPEVPESTGGAFVGGEPVKALDRKGWFKRWFTGDAKEFKESDHPRKDDGKFGAGGGGGGGGGGGEKETEKSGKTEKKKKRHLMGSASSKEDMEKLIKQKMSWGTVKFEPKGENEWEVHSGKGKVDGLHLTEKKGRFRLERDEE